MKKSLLFTFTFCIVLMACKKDDKLTGAEKNLLGHWNLSQKIIQIPGEPNDTIGYSSSGNCFMKFHDQDYGYGNLRWLEDNKDCNWGGGGWRLEGANKLVLINLDTVQADILENSGNTLVFKAYPHTYAPDKTITYSFHR